MDIKMYIDTPLTYNKYIYDVDIRKYIYGFEHRSLDYMI